MTDSTSLIRIYDCYQRALATITLVLKLVNLKLVYAKVYVQWAIRLHVHMTYMLQHKPRQFADKKQKELNLRCGCIGAYTLGLYVPDEHNNQNTTVALWKFYLTNGRWHLPHGITVKNI